MNKKSFLKKLRNSLNFQNQKEVKKENSNQEKQKKETKKTNLLDEIINRVNFSHKTPLIFKNLLKADFPDGKAIIKIRKEEIDALFCILGKRKNRNVLIVGANGTGREQLVQGIAETIKEQKQKTFQKTLMLEIPTEQFNPNSNELVDIVNRVNTLFDIAKSSKVIFYFKNIENLIEYGMMDVFQLIFQKAICIGILDADEESLINLNIGKYGFVTYFSEVPKQEYLYTLNQGTIKALEKHHRVKISKEIFNSILNESLALTWDTQIADVIDITDEAASIASNRGLKEVDIRCVLETNRQNINYVLKKGDEYNTFIASHEAGHSIIALHYNIGVKAITIIPQGDDEVGGFNLFEKNENSLSTEDDIKEQIQVALGGYVGTLHKGYPLTYGAAGDLIEVSKNARAMFLYFGMEEGKPISYLNDNDEIELSYMSDEMKTELNNKVDGVIKNSCKEAEKIISEHEKQFDLIIKALKKKGFLTKEELLDLYNGNKTLEDIPDIRSIIFND